MFFFLSKTISLLMMPLPIVVACLLVAWWVKNVRWKKGLFVAGISLLIFFSNEFIANECMRAWEIPVTPFSEIRRTYTYGILLTGAARTGVGPTDRVYIFSSADRVNHTLQLYKLGYIKKVLISGGTGKLINAKDPEAEALFSLLKLMGVPEGDMVLESRARNTHESAVYVKEMLDSIAKPEECLLITSAFHMRRSRACFAKVGWKMDTFSADVHSQYRKFTPETLFIPKVEALNNWQILFKEWIGITAYWMAGYL